MKHRALIVAASLIAGALTLGPAQPTEAQVERVSKWEYKRAENPSDKVLTQLGNDGWELVTATGGHPFATQSSVSLGTTPGGTTTRHTIDHTKLIYVFKRPKVQ